MITNRSEHIDEESLAGLHPFAVTDRKQILELLDSARQNRRQLSRGLNYRADLEIAQILSISDTTLSLETSGFRRNARNQFFLNFEASGRPHFFSSQSVGRFDGNIIEVQIPEAIYCAERRDRNRLSISRINSPIEVSVPDGPSLKGRVEDISPGGLGISVPSRLWDRRWRTIDVRYRHPDETERRASASVRSVTTNPTSGWTRVGLAESNAAFENLIEPEVWNQLPRFADRIDHPTKSGVPVSESDYAAELVRFADQNGHEIVGFVDQRGAGADPTCIILHTGWGETKETLLPLAQTIVETFDRDGESVVVLRIDGVNQRGESYKNPECRIQGKEYNAFCFSQSVQDIAAAIAYAQSRFTPKSTILVSQSVAALAARKFLANDRRKLVDAWVSIVGSPDLQSVSRSISGGIDFAVGFERGIRFGYQELLGIVIHADQLMRDAAAIGVLHIEDARTDLGQIDIPIAWFHGEYDAWVDLRRVRDVLSHGPSRDRKLAVIPTAHRLGWSKQAQDTFLSISQEVARLAIGRRLSPVAPDKQRLSRKRAAERLRRPRLQTNLRSFWKDYLIGRDGSIGIELMTSCDPYGSLMADQIELLNVNEGNQILDLGCGTGSFVGDLASATARGVENLSVVGLDHIPEALDRARSRHEKVNSNSSNVKTSWIAADLDLGAGSLDLPIASRHFDRVIASLVLSYLGRPDFVLSEMLRVLKPGGTLVVSSLLKDADISRLYIESITQLSLSEIDSQLPDSGRLPLDAIARNFLNDASKILDLEAEGSFVFWEPDQLVGMLDSAGFVRIKSRISFGNPGQAVVVSAQRP
jgi:ubiquinone/menaquinone biosynthesis C-methylase UbiE/pimeloyl-ACP methyl ester carboxylesterase